MAKTYPNNPFNILGVYFSASTSAKAQGMSWYSDANRICNDLARVYSVNPKTAAGVIAALSPNVRWERNVADAENIIAAFAACNENWRETKVSAYPLNRDKSAKILLGDSDLDYIPTILGGNKTKAFYGCISDPSNSDEVCVDGHARCIFYGHREALKSKSMGDREYHHIADAYRECAEIIRKTEEIDITPMQVQAVTWVHWRELHNI